MLLALLLSAAHWHGAAAQQYFESNPGCGFVTDGFVRFELSTAYHAWPSMGVCDWGFDTVLPRPSDMSGTLDQCLQCTFVPWSQSAECPEGFDAAGAQQYDLYPESGCRQTGCLGLQCPSGDVEFGQPGICPNGAEAHNCCSPASHQMCCKPLQCIQRDVPAGQCLDSNRDLLPGQAISHRQYGVPAAADCTQYALSPPPLAVCQADRTFASEFYNDCRTVPSLDRDSSGCPVVPGYVLQPGLPADLQQAALDDGTPWSQLSLAGARAAAASDYALLAARCDQTDGACNWFATDDDANLHSYLPAPLELQTMSNSSSIADRPCQGVYVRQAQPAPGSCARIPGYLFKPQVSVAPAAAPARCLDCWNASSLAAQCSQDSQCTGFSNLHGLLHEPFPRLADRVAFTTSPCYGSYQRVGSGPGAPPVEAEALDRLLCGDNTYCQAAIEYDGSNASSGNVALRLTLLRPLVLPSSLTAPDAQSALMLPVLPRVWSLTITCAQGAVLLRGVPRPLFVMFPNLQQLSISGCGMAGLLPPDWAQLQSLRVLDVSRNALRGTLPQQFSTLRLDHLNLSSNALTGGIPSSWFRVMQPSANANATSTPQPIAGAAYAADLSSNSLVGPLQRSFVEGACRWGDAYLDFGGLSAAAPAGAGMPGWVLWGNGDLQSWALPYAYAVRRSRYSAEEGQTNMCGSYQ